MSTDLFKDPAFFYFLYVKSLLVATVVLLFSAAINDLFTRRISNMHSVGIFLLGLNLRILSCDVLYGAIAFVLLFAATFCMWMRGFLGGADAKLIPATAFAMPLDHFFSFLFFAALGGGLIAIAYWCSAKLGRFDADLLKGRRNWIRGLRAEYWRIMRGKTIPYAVPIAASAALNAFGLKLC